VAYPTRMNRTCFLVMQSMAMTKTKQSKTAVIHQGAIEQVSTLLENLPAKPKEQWSLREAIRQMQAPIQAALNKGYSYEEVAQVLDDKGIGVRVSTLKSYLAAGKRQAATEDGVPAQPRKKRAKREPGNKTAALASAPAAIVTEPTAPPLADTEQAADTAPTPRKRGRMSNADKEKAAATANDKPTSPRAPRKSASETKTTTRTSTRGRKKAGS
jgi:hypothetical protein